MKDFVRSNSHKKSKMNVDSDVNPALKRRVFQFVWRPSLGKVKPFPVLETDCPTHEIKNTFYPVVRIHQDVPRRPGCTQSTWGTAT